jgi:hypothetical protein
MSIMDQVKLNLREWYSLAADRTSEMTKISVRMYDKYGISREIERQLSELGCFVYHAVEAGREDFVQDEAFQAAVARIQGLERDLAAKIQEIEGIRRQRQQKASGPQDAETQAEEPVDAHEPPQEPADTTVTGDRDADGGGSDDPDRDRESVDDDPSDGAPAPERSS